MDASRPEPQDTSPTSPAWKLLIKPHLPRDTRASLIVAIFSDRNEVSEVNHLCGEDAQTLVDVVDEVGTFPLQGMHLVI